MNEEAKNGGKIQGLKNVYKNAEDSDKINTAKIFLHKNDYNLDLLLQQEGFKDYKNSKDYSRFIRKFINNRGANVKKGNPENQSVIAESIGRSSIEEEDRQTVKSGAQSTTTYLSETNVQKRKIRINYAPIISQEILLKHFENFKTSNYMQKQQILQEIVGRNVETLLTFLENFEKALDQQICDDLFPLLTEIILNNNTLAGDSKARIFLVALGFYQGEDFNVDEALLKDAMLTLIKQPSLRQALGLANFVLINETPHFSKYEALVKKIDDVQAQTINQMRSTYEQMEMDKEVIMRVPISFFILNVPFIQIVKQNAGLDIIREIPPIFLEYYVKICAICTASSTEALKDFVESTRSAFIQNKELINEQCMLSFYKALSIKLQNRDPTWIGKVEKIKQLQEQLLSAQIEKEAVPTAAIIDKCLAGDTSDIERILQLPKAMEALSEQTILQLLYLFKSKNDQIELVQAFCQKPESEQLQVTEQLDTLQQNLGFRLYGSQILCINYINNNLSTNHFINFGIGNGKTLICISLAILLALQTRKSIFIVSKNEHLILRDSNKYKKVIDAMGINANMNLCGKGAGIFFYTLPQLSKQQNQVKLQSIWKDSIVLIDEYDWVLFDGSEKVISERLIFFKQAHQCIGFTGSSLSVTEARCLSLAFKTQPVVFPSLDKLKGDKKTQYGDILISSNQQDYLAKMKQLISKEIRSAPVLIVAGESYNMIEQGLFKSGFDFTSLSRSQAANIESVIDGKYLLKNALKQYGVYLLNESQGRGTDIQTNEEINSNGGSFLIIADIFSPKSEEQIIGRIGRLNTRGKWQRVLYKYGVMSSAQQLLVVEQPVKQEKLESKLRKVQSILEEYSESEQMVQVEPLNVQAQQQQEQEAQIDQKIKNDNQSSKETAAPTSPLQVNVQVEEEKKEEVEEEGQLQKFQENMKDEATLECEQPSFSELIANELSKIPQLENKPIEELQHHARSKLKRSYDQISQRQSRSRTNSRTSSKTIGKRGRKQKVKNDSDKVQKIK